MRGGEERGRVVDEDPFSLSRLVRSLDLPALPQDFKCVEVRERILQEVCKNTSVREEEERGAVVRKCWLV